MNNLLNPLHNDQKDKQINKRNEGGLYVKEDDQDWGSAGMNDIQNESELNQ
tara:strand:+ start:866 stop:1018 length:153 start_codon:yes stop_codon:yes gene_type:complete